MADLNRNRYRVTYYGYIRKGRGQEGALREIAHRFIWEITARAALVKAWVLREDEWRLKKAGLGEARAEHPEGNVITSKPEMR